MGLSKGLNPDMAILVLLSSWVYCILCLDSVESLCTLTPKCDLTPF